MDTPHRVAIELHFLGLAPDPLVQRVRDALNLIPTVSNVEVDVDHQRVIDPVRLANGKIGDRMRPKGVLNVSVVVLAHDQEAASAAGLAAAKEARREAGWRLTTQYTTSTVLPLKSPSDRALAQVA